MNEAWTVHCPDCQSAVGVVGAPARVTCTACDSTFQPTGLQTTISAPAKTIAPDPLIGTRLGPWTLVRLIGRGGMGTVYEARDTPKQRRVALKVLRDDLAADPGFVKRFHRESKVLARLSHPHIVEVLEQGEDDGRLWFAMEYVRGESLRQRMRKELPFQDATRIADQIASALAYAHEHGVVHRDLKPENVLLDDDGMVRLVDFGLSKLVDLGRHGATTHLTRTDVIMGTYEYMAPEQRRGDRDIDARADVFSLGVIVYEMLTGHLPLGRFALPSESDAAAPRSFDVVVTKALAMKPADRYASAMAFRGDLLHAARTAASKPRRSDTPPPPPPLPLPEPPTAAAERKVYRHVEILAALDRVGGILALLAALGGLSFFAFAFSVPFLPLLTFPLALGLIGLWLIRQGGRLQRMEPGAREAQVTASVLLLFVPPFLTALGIYGLIVMTSDAARRAMPSRRQPFGPAKHRRRRHDAQPDEVLGPEHVSAPPPPLPVKGTPASVVAEPITTYSEPRAVMRRSPSLLLRGFLLLMILWTINSTLILLDVEAFRRDITNIGFSTVQDLFIAGILCGIVAVIAVFYQVVVRKKREGLALAVFALILAASSAIMMFNAWWHHPAHPHYQDNYRHRNRVELIHTHPSLGFRR